MAKTTDKKQNLQKSDSEIAKRKPDEIKRIAAFARKLEGAQPPKFKEDENGKRALTDELMDRAAMLEALGTVDVDLSNLLITQAQRTIFGPDLKGVNKCNTVLAALHGIKPRDELEGLLAVQMVGVHNLAMEFMKRAMLENQTFEGTNMATAKATKLLRTFTMQLDALNRYRGKGQQKVTVKHVHVNEGGQAIVGNVEGGGVNAKKRG